jgi:hypothetical protein
MAHSVSLHEVRRRANTDLEHADLLDADDCLDQLPLDAGLDPVVLSLFAEAVRTYHAGSFKATAVLVGGAAERTILGIRDALVHRIAYYGHPIPKKLHSWQITTVFDTLTDAIRQLGSSMLRCLRDDFDAHWPMLLEHVRVARYAAWHPRGIEPVSGETARASLLLFPRVARLGSEVREFVRDQYR